MCNINSVVTVLYYILSNVQQTKTIFFSDRNFVIVLNLILGKSSTYSRVPNKRTGRLLENEKKSHLYALIQDYTFINFEKKVPPARSYFGLHDY